MTLRDTAHVIRRTSLRYLCEGPFTPSESEDDLRTNKKDKKH